MTKNKLLQKLKNKKDLKNKMKKKKVKMITMSIRSLIKKRQKKTIIITNNVSSFGSAMTSVSMITPSSIGP